jgi:thioredoxin 1
VAELSKKAPYAGIVHFRVDYDRQKDLMKRFGARDRSTLILFKGNHEAGRLEWETSPKAIQALLDKGF